MMAATGTRITAAPGRLTSPVGWVYRPPRSRRASRWAATSVPHRSSGSVQVVRPTMAGPHQVVTAIPMATRHTVASTGNSLLTGHGLAAGAGPPTPAGALGTAPGVVGENVTVGSPSCVAPAEGVPHGGRGAEAEQPDEREVQDRPGRGTQHGAVGQRLQREPAGRGEAVAGQHGQDREERLADL